MAKISSLDENDKYETEETWIHEKSDGSKIYYPMRIFNGKDFNVLKLNATNLNEIKEYADFLKNHLKCILIITIEKKF